MPYHSHCSVEMTCPIKHHSVKVLAFILLTFVNTTRQSVGVSRHPFSEAEVTVHQVITDFQDNVEFSLDLAISKFNLILQSVLQCNKHKQ